jgi:coenzyme PQQ precursor peptide PqqA
VQTHHPVEGGQPPELPEPEPGMVEQRMWFPPAFEDFETAMEVTAYVCRR